MPGHGFVHTSSPTSPRTGWPASSNTSTAIPSDGPPNEHGDSGSTTCGERKHAPTSVPPEMLITGQRPSPTRLEVPAPRAFVPRLTGRGQDAQRRTVVGVDGVVAVRHQRADQRRRDAEHADAVPFDERPQPIGLGIVGRAVVEHEGAAVGEGADDLPRSHDPTDVGEPEQPLVAAHVGLERGFLRDLREEPAVHVHRALRPAGRAARVGDEERMLAVERPGLEAALAGRRQLGEGDDRDRRASARRDRGGAPRRPCAPTAPTRRRRRPSPSSARPCRAG